MHNLSQCPNKTTTTATCFTASSYSYPPWVIEAEQRNKKYMSEVVKCHGR